MREWSEKQKKYQEFLATPPKARDIVFGCNTERDFCKDVLEVDRSTAWRWKQLPGWIETINHLALSSQGGKFGELYESIMEKAIKGDPQSQRLMVEVGKNMLNQYNVNTVVVEKQVEDMTEADLLDRLSFILNKEEPTKSLLN